MRIVLESNNIKVKQKNKEIKKMALYMLKGHWLEALLLMLAFSIANYLPDFFSDFFSEATDSFDFINFGFSLLSIALTGPFTLSLYACFLKLCRFQKIQKEDLLCGFLHYGKALICGAVYFIYTMLMTQGYFIAIFAIVCLLRYILVYFIMVDEPEINALQALSKSRYLMLGNKSKMASLMISFMGWYILVSFLNTAVQLVFYPEILEESRAAADIMMKALQTQSYDILNSINYPSLMESIKDVRLQILEQIIPLGLYAYFTMTLTCFYELVTGKIVTQ